MKILIATGVYPPQLGGPAQYAVNLGAEFRRRGHRVQIATYTFERRFPTGLRHLLFLLKIIPKLAVADRIFALDNFSVAFPAVLGAKFFGKKVVIRTGGDFLWEAFVERTKRKVLLSNFYRDCFGELNTKERLLFRLIRWTFGHAGRVVFSTSWQREIFREPYKLSPMAASVVENCYMPWEVESSFEKRLFIGASRSIVFKNLEVLRRAFTKAQLTYPDIELDLRVRPHHELIAAMRVAYATVVVSLGEISPNLILEGLGCGKPFVLSTENGVSDRLSEFGVFADPLDEESITRALIEICDSDTYRRKVENIRNSSFTHGWSEIADELLQAGDPG